MNKKRFIIAPIITWTLLVVSGLFVGTVAINAGLINLGLYGANHHQAEELSNDYEIDANISKASDAGREDKKKRCEDSSGVWTYGHGLLTEGKCTEKQIVEKCEEDGGVWMLGPFGEGPFCNKKYSDGGQECADSRQCLSKQCMVRPDLYNHLPKGSEGKCADWQINYGCFGLLKRGIITNYACRD